MGSGVKPREGLVFWWATKQDPSRYFLGRDPKSLTGSSAQEEKIPIDYKVVVGLLYLVYEIYSIVAGNVFNFVGVIIYGNFMLPDTLTLSQDGTIFYINCAIPVVIGSCFIVPMFLKVLFLKKEAKNIS